MTNKLDLDDYLPYLLNRAGAKIADAFGRVCRRHGINLQTWRVLAALHQKDGQNVGSLAKMTSIDVSTLSRLLDQMQKKRLLLRRRGAADQRSFAVHRTAAGEAITERLIPTALACEQRAAMGMDQRQAKALKEMLRRLYANVETLDEIETLDARQARRSKAPKR